MEKQQTDHDRSIPLGKLNVMNKVDRRVLNDSQLAPASCVCIFFQTYSDADQYPINTGHKGKL